MEAVMNYSNLLAPLIFVGFFVLLSLPSFMAEQEEPACQDLEYHQRARLHVLTVCEDTLYDTGTGHRHFQDSIKTIRETL